MMLYTLTLLQKDNRRKLITRAYADKCMHIPSALSMLDYFYFLDKKIDYSSDALIIGKPYGLLAYHTVWNSNNNKLITGKHSNVVWADTTLGNCLGVACGIVLSQKYDTVFINTGDASLQEGTMLEAALFIGAYNCKTKITLCIDCNKYLCISKNYLSLNDIYCIFKAFKWNVLIVNGHNDNELKHMEVKDSQCPLCLLFDTVKGYGIDFMQCNPIDWHYKQLDANAFKCAMALLEE